MSNDGHPMKGHRFVAWLIAAGIIAASPALADTPTGAARELATKTCAVLAARVDEIPGSGPVFLRSYDSSFGQGPTAEPALANAAFTYDNALAAIALTACGHRAHAQRIGEALLSAVNLDRAGTKGRLRNTYRAGAQTQRPIPPMGWWDVVASRWFEDPYQVGTATGNVAWAALALLTLSEVTGKTRFRDGAAVLAEWTVQHTRDGQGPDGFTGGVHGYDDAPQVLTWKSTEHNTDLVAVFDWLDRAGAPGDWSHQAKAARAFLDAVWDEASGHFFVGTTPDGVTVNRAVSSLDVQLWPLLLHGALERWQRSLTYAEGAHAVDGGFDFNDDRDGLWVEGTAQAALAFRAVGRATDADRLLAEVAKELSPSGYIWATRQPSISTGLAIGPSSATDDFRYYRRPHLGATAWAAMAALSWNPFTGQRLQPVRVRTTGSK
ncbi:hypothetical protein [Azospirillum sp.]|uniref:hypothetical protein n=1 Tax=Azospirillum sp. TaxID=34012 RepID=UPI003D70653B